MRCGLMIMKPAAHDPMEASGNDVTAISSHLRAERCFAVAEMDDASVTHTVLRWQVEHEVHHEHDGEHDMFAKQAGHVLAAHCTK